jgi:hypothetical protein
MDFGFGSGFADNQQEEGEVGWADEFEDNGSYDLGFAANQLREVLNPSTPGNKQKRAGLGVEANFNYNNEKDQL